MTHTYHATPYDISATGFYFSNYDEYLRKFSTHQNDYGDLVEEYEIQFIDGDNCHLFFDLDVNQANLQQWFNDFEDLDAPEAVKVIYLAKELGYYMADINQSRIDDVILFEGTILEYVEDYIQNTGMLDALPENLHYYFNREKFARDMQHSGSITTVEVEGTSYVVEVS